MDKMFNAILEMAGFDVKDVRLLRHKDRRAKKNRTPYELWQKDLPKFELYQAKQSFENESRLKARYWASFVGTPDKETLFVGIYEILSVRVLERDMPLVYEDGVDKAGSCNFYDLVLDPRLNEQIGKMIIEWGPGYRSWIQRSDRQNKQIIRY